MLVVSHGIVWVEASYGRRLTFDGTNSFRLVVAQWLAEAVIVAEWNDRLRQMVEIAAQDVGSVVNCVTRPIQAFSVPRRGIECSLELFDPLLRASQAKYPLYIGGCGALVDGGE
jgi:hypothetical protein